MILTDILEEHLEEADFLWQQRENALFDRAYNLDDLAEIEERLLAHLDGLVLGEKEAWKLLEPKLADGALGEVFAATFVAFACCDRTQMESVTKTFEQAEGPILNGIRHAWRHTSCAEIEKVVRPYLASERSALQSAALDILSFRRLPIDSRQLHQLLNHTDPAVVCSAIQAVGRLKVREMKGEVERALGSEVPEVVKEAMKTGLLLGSDSALQRCRTEIKNLSALASDAMILIGLVGHLQDASLLLDLLREPALSRNAIIAMGLLGGSRTIERLIQLTTDPIHARLACEAIVHITGVNLKDAQLVVNQPVEKSSESDEFIDDPDEDLPCPDPVKMASWWKNNAARFDNKVRYRHGQPYGSQILLDRIQNGNLPERHHAAFELAIGDPSAPFLETFAFAGPGVLKGESLK